MAYKTAYMILLDGELKVFVGNYDNLADVLYDHDKRYFYCWEEKNAFYVRRLTAEERKEIKRAG